MTFTLNCHPPTTTAQMKRVRVVNGKPRFFHGAKMQQHVRDWSWLLKAHVPARPLTGPLELSVSFHYPHTQHSLKRGAMTRKWTRPDIDGVAKHFIDTMQRAGFFTDDAHIQTLILNKWHDDAPCIRVFLDVAGPVLGESKRSMFDKRKRAAADR